MTSVKTKTDLENGWDAVQRGALSSCFHRHCAIFQWDFAGRRLAIVQLYQSIYLEMFEIYDKNSINLLYVIKP